VRVGHAEGYLDARGLNAVMEGVAALWTHVTSPLVGMKIFVNRRGL
jgi:hypothetical protein